MHAETEGNPFFVSELLRHLAESGALVNEDGVWRLAVSVSEMSIPDGIREVVGRRLSRLSEPTNAVLSWAAVIGREVRLDILAAVAGDQEDCLDAIDEAVDARLVDEVGAGRWRFSHALVRSTLLAELRTTRRVRMHLAVADAYELHAPNDLAALAQHFSEAAPLGAGEKAVGYLVRAGDEAIANLAFDEAADLYRRALDVIDDIDLDVAALAADATIGLAVAKRWTGREFRDEVAHALDLATAIGDGTRMARVLLETRRGFVAQVFEVDDVLVAQIERCLEHLGTEDSIERVRMTAALAQELAYADVIPHQLALTHDALAMARRLDDPLALHEALVARVAVANNVDHLAELPALTHEARANLDRLSAPGVRAAVCAYLTGLGGWFGDRAVFQAGIDGIAAVGDALPPHFRWLRLAQECGYELRWGSLAVAESLAAELLERANETGEPDAALWYVNCMGFTHRQAGRYEDALAMFAPLMDTDTPVAPISGVVVAMLLCEAERHDEARPIVERYRRWGREHPRNQSLLPNLGTLAVAAAELGDVDDAAYLLAELEPLTAYWSAWSGQAPIAPVLTIVGRLRTTLEDFEGAEAALTEAIAHCRSTDANFFLADALLYQGLARREAGGTGEPVTGPIVESLVLATAGGYETLRRRAAQALAGS